MKPTCLLLGHLRTRMTKCHVFIPNCQAQWTQWAIFPHQYCARKDMKTTAGSPQQLHDLDGRLYPSMKPRPAQGEEPLALQNNTKAEITVVSHVCVLLMIKWYCLLIVNLRNAKQGDFGHQKTHIITLMFKSKFRLCQRTDQWRLPGDYCFMLPARKQLHFCGRRFEVGAHKQILIPGSFHRLCPKQKCST